MIKSLLVLFAATFSLITLAQQNVIKPGYFVVKGQVKNFKKPGFDFTMTTYLGKTDGSIMVRPDGSFEQKLPVQNVQNLFFYLNDDAILLTILDKDTLYLNWDDLDFAKSFAINGKNNLRTKELQLQLRLNAEFHFSFFNLLKKLSENMELSAEEKFNLVNELYNQNTQAVFQNSDFFSTTLEQVITGLYFRYTNILWQLHLLPQFKLKLLDSTGSYPYVDMLNANNNLTQLNEVWFWNIPEYRDFIYNYVTGFDKPFTSTLVFNTDNIKPFNSTLEKYYKAEVNIDIIPIKDWFVTQAIIYGFENYTFADVEKVYKQFMLTCKTPYFKSKLQKYYTAISHLKPGSPAPVFVLKNEKGQMVSLNSFKGKVIYIDFWGIYCAPCIEEIQNHIPKLHETYRDKDVVFINICIDAEENKWKDALKKYKLNGINLIAQERSHPVNKAYNIHGIPNYVLIDKTGKIVDKDAPRASELNSKTGKNAIDTLLK